MFVSFLYVGVTEVFIISFFTVFLLFLIGDWDFFSLDCDVLFVSFTVGGVTIFFDFFTTLSQVFGVCFLETIATEGDFLVVLF